MDDAYARHYRDLYERHWWWRAREAALLEMLRRLEPADGWRKILDIGCGDGLFFDCLLQFGDVEGVEPSGELVDPAGPHRHRIHVRPFDAHFNPRDRYSLILLLDVVEHMDDPAGALRHAVSLLEPRGTILITVPAFNVLWTHHDVINHHRTRYTRATFRTVADRAGLRIDEERYWFQWTFPMKLAERVVERVAGRAAAAPRVPAAWLNAALYAWSRLEHRLLNRLSPPFGSSLVVAGARRSADSDAAAAN